MNPDNTAAGAVEIEAKVWRDMLRRLLGRRVVVPKTGRTSSKTVPVHLRVPHRGSPFFSKHGRRTLRGDYYACTKRRPWTVRAENRRRNAIAKASRRRNRATSVR